MAFCNCFLLPSNQCNKTLGILGFGSVGKALANITKGFGLNYLINDIRVNNDYNKSDNFKFCTLEELFSESDIISIHTNLTSETDGLIDYSLLSPRCKEISFVFCLNSSIELFRTTLVSLFAAIISYINF